MDYYVVDAFADALFGGNPAGVCLLAEWPDEALMQRIASENNLPETAFAVRGGEEYGLRWFTPEKEIDLCGHATLGTAYVLANFYDRDARVFRFRTKSGLLTVTKKDGIYELDFPSRAPEPVPLEPEYAEALGAKVLEAHRSRDLLLLLESEQAVRDLRPNLDLIKAIPDVFAVIVTAKGDSGSDFVSRFFAPAAGIPEDPVTGSSHSTLIPFWAERLGKKTLVARQLSKRGGTLYCEDKGSRVLIGGRAVLYLRGKIVI